jgi:hypothetical protein
VDAIRLCQAEQAEVHKRGKEKMARYAASWRKQLRNRIMNPFADIPDNQLTYQYWEKSKAQALAEQDWQIKDHSRRIVLAELTNQFANSGDSIAAAEKKALTSKEYKDFLIELGESRSKLVIARAKTAALEHEIRMRLNKSFQERAEYKAGHLTP